MVDIALVGLTADPITVGHEWLALTAHATGNFEQVWFMPCFGHKLGKDPSDATNRLAMCRIVADKLTEETGKPFGVSDFEITNKSSGSAYSTLLKMHGVFPNHRFWWTMGMDNALLIEKWHNSAALIQEFPILVCRRGGIEVPEGDHWFMKEPHIFVSSSGSIQCAASSFRTLCKDERFDEARRYVRPEVYDYIVRNGLYLEGGES